MIGHQRAPETKKEIFRIPPGSYEVSLGLGLVLGLTGRMTDRRRSPTMHAGRSIAMKIYITRCIALAHTPLSSAETDGSTTQNEEVRSTMRVESCRENKNH